MVWSLALYNWPGGSENRKPHTWDVIIQLWLYTHQTWTNYIKFGIVKAYSNYRFHLISTPLALIGRHQTGFTAPAQCFLVRSVSKPPTRRGFLFSIDPFIPLLLQILLFLLLLLPPPTHQPKNQSSDRSIHQSTNRPFKQSINQPIKQPINQPINRSTDLSTNEPTQQPTNQSNDRTINQSVNRWTHQPNQPIHQRINVSTNQPIEQPMKQSRLPEPSQGSRIDGSLKGLYIFSLL